MLTKCFSIVFLLFNYYTLPQEKFLSNFVNEYNQINGSKRILMSNITDLRINYYSNNKVNISLTKWSEKYSKEISKVINKNNIQYAFVSDNEKYETVFSDYFFYAVIKEINLPYATRNFFNEVASYKMKLIKISEKCRIKKVLITGSAGFLGFHCAKKFLRIIPLAMFME